MPAFRKLPYDPYSRLNTAELQTRKARVVYDLDKISRKVKLARFGTNATRNKEHHDQDFNNSEPGDAKQAGGQNEIPSLSHLTSSGEAHMIDISRKKDTFRSASAVSYLLFSSPLTQLTLENASAQKGDAIAVARVAGIQAAKKTADLIPLTHPSLNITGVTVDIETLPQGQKIRRTGYAQGGVKVTATVDCWGKTGVEMEALTAASMATLTMFDMLKGVDKSLLITDTRVIAKRGGKSGTWLWNEEKNRLWKQVDTVEATNMTSEAQQQYKPPRPLGTKPKTQSNTIPANEEQQEATPSHDHNTISNTTAERHTSKTNMSQKTIENTQDIDEDDPQAVFEAEWNNLTRDFNSNMLSGDATKKPDASGFRQQWVNRYDEWKKTH